MFSPGKYLREVQKELHEVSWPTRVQTIEMTVLVIGVAIIIAAYIGALDWVFQQLLAQVLI